MILYEDDNVRVEMHVTGMWERIAPAHPLSVVIEPPIYCCAMRWSDNSKCNTHSVTDITITACHKVFRKKAE